MRLRPWIATLALLAAAPGRGDSTAPDVRAAPPASPASVESAERLLQQAQMRLDPNTEIGDAVAMCDRLLDANLRDKRAWLVLANALAIGFARSRHADSPLAARRAASEVDPADCHLAALVARSELAGGASPTLERWHARADACAEMAYLQSTRDGAHAVELLTQSRRRQPSAEGLVALGAAQLRQGHLDDAAEAYRAALAAAPLFPEDWRMDGWTAVHANLGLALVYTRQSQAKPARAHLKAARAYLADPGPWHDLSDEERRWARQTLHLDLR